VCIDDASRVSYAEVLADEKGITCTAFLERAAAWLRERGIVIQRVMTDNGSGYRSKAFRRLLRCLGARHIFTRPYTPRTNGKAERFIQTCKREWATSVPTVALMHAPPPSPPSSAATTATAPTGASAGSPPNVVSLNS